MSVMLMQPANAIGWSEMPFGRDTHVVPSNSVLDRGPVFRVKGNLRRHNPQFILMLPIAKLLWHLLLFVIMVLAVL